MKDAEEKFKKATAEMQAKLDSRDVMIADLKKELLNKPDCED